MTNLTYDEIPYASLVYADTHPNKLATLATLFGLTPPAVKTGGRILELGCGNGTNLIAIAQTLPQAQCWGIDAAIKQIQAGQNQAKQLGLSNVNLKQLNLSEVDESLGIFDYIIAHGLYSWITPALQDTLLSLCQRLLAPQGIVYISYNVYPGWHMENVVRDLMKYHTQQLPPVPFEISMKQAKGIINFIAHLRQQSNTAFDLLLQEKTQLFKIATDNYLYHDFLELDNHPVYFHQFIQNATQHQLAYVTDIEFRHYLMLSFPHQVVEALEELFQGDFFKQEQYLDFFYNRTLRRSLLCHQTVPVQRNLHWENITQCYIANASQPVNSNLAPELFQTLAGETIAVKQPLTKIAMAYLATHYPRCLHFEELFQYAYQQHSPTEAHLSTLRANFAQELLYLYCLEAIEFHIEPPAFVTTLNSYPTASPLARHMVSQGQQPVINLRCEFIYLDEVATALLPHLNGQKDKSTLIIILKTLVKQQKIKLPPQEDIKLVLEKTLFQLLQSALLVA
jgi:methyltransferase-like protein/ubiquinone/menaquinone biosynthesis C-methylase UbiE